ncbi:MAG: ubiquinol-cytochrome c reductase iron-sulfur subunit N-terminal domain-containing protein, partial [Pseudomonadota bacterium]
MAGNKKPGDKEPNRRDFLYIATGVMGAVGAAGAAWPLVSQMAPDASTLA